MKILPKSPYKLLAITIVVLIAAVYFYPRIREGFTDGSADATFTMVYAEWCPHCKTVKPMFKEAVDASPITLNGKKVNFEMVEEKETEKLKALPKVDGFPTFFLKTAANVGAPIQYNGERDVSAMKSFIESHL